MEKKIHGSLNSSMEESGKDELGTIFIKSDIYDLF